MSWFKKPDPKDQMRQQDRVLRKTERDIGRERTKLEREEKQLEMEIKKAAKMGNKPACAILAKQLIQLRKQKQRTFVVSSNVMAIKGQGKAMQSNATMATAMASTTKAMGNMNKQMNPMEVAKTMQEFEKQNMKMEMNDEIINDTLDQIMDDSDDEAEADSLVNQVLDEIGIEIKGKVAEAPSPHAGKLGETEKSGVSDADIDRMLQQLKS